MNGTSRPANLPMRLMPPISTEPTIRLSTSPVIQPGTAKYSLVMSATLHDWNMFPPVSDESIMQSENSTASVLPTHARSGFSLAKALSATHIGPPCGLSGSSVFR